MKMYVCVCEWVCVWAYVWVCVWACVWACVCHCVCVCLCMFPCFNTCTRSKFGNHKGCTSETKLFNQRGIETHFGHVNRFNHCMFWTFRNRFFFVATHLPRFDTNPRGFGETRQSHIFSKWNRLNGPVRLVLGLKPCKATMTHCYEVRPRCVPNFVSRTKILDVCVQYALPHG
jgi:hypothetical protein